MKDPADRWKQEEEPAPARAASSWRLALAASLVALTSGAGLMQWRAQEAGRIEAEKRAADQQREIDALVEQEHREARVTEMLQRANEASQSAAEADLRKRLFLSEELRRLDEEQRVIEASSARMKASMAALTTTAAPADAAARRPIEPRR